MTPYYTDEAVALYCGDCRAILPTIGPVDHVITDPPYDEQTHAGARTLGLETRRRASTGQRGIVASAAIEIDFAALPDVQEVADLHRQAQRWCLVFCALEMLGEYRRAAGDAWVRGGFWRRPDGAPQISGDRPAQPGEGLAILHRAGPKRWNGGGHHAYFEHCVVKHGRQHPTEKPERLMAELVTLFTDPGDLILDPFAGSGTTAVAAKRLGRRCILIEREERYCAIAAGRLSQGALDLFEVTP